ncbi:MAG: FAD-dependent oxidoreductase [Ethanoligenens sp.]
MIEREVVIVGAGPAGLSAALEAADAGAQVLVVDLNMRPGGQLFKQIHKFFGSAAHQSGMRGIDIGRGMLEQAEQKGVEIWLNSTVVGLFPGEKIGVERGGDNGNREFITIHAKKIIVASGATENAVRFKGWTLPGVMGAGAAQTMVNVNRVRPGSRVLMLGSGNVGLIVSYQLMQAGCDVAALVEAAPKIGGYAVHAAKITRAGVPIYLKHTITEAFAGKDGTLRGAVIAGVDEQFQPIPGTERSIEADVITIAVGLKPIGELLRLMNCKFVFHSAFGGYVPLHNRNMETSCKGIYVAGDATGVEEANTALEEGRIAGVSAAQKLGYLSEETAAARLDEIWSRLDALRLGPFGARRASEKQRILEEYAHSLQTTASQLEGTAS